MKKVKFTHHRGALYATLCAGIMAVGAAAYVGYRSAVGSTIRGVISPDSGPNLPELDYSAVDAVVPDVRKTAGDQSGENQSQNAAAQNQNALQTPQSAENAGAASQQGEGGNQNTPNGANAGAAGAPQTPADNQGAMPEMPEISSPTQQNSDEALLDISGELEALYYKEAVMMPINGEVITEYSGGELVKSSGGVWRTHDGVDIAAAEGDGVKAMTSGTVSEIYSDPLWGNCVIVDHGNTLSGCYFGLSDDVLVNVGDRLNAGEVIGKVGNTADIESDLGPHLHFALKYQNQWIDPVGYIEPMK